MTIREVINKVLEYHPNLGENYHGCDDFKSGNPDVECTGVITTMAATVNVVKKAIELGANLIFVHEPTYYTSADEAGWNEDFKNDVYEEKRKMLEDNGIVVWRDHDHMHTHNPDGIFTGVLKYTGWEKYATIDRSMGMFAHWVVDLPEAMTVEALNKHLMECIGMNGVRYIGKPDTVVKKIALVAHLYPMGGPKEYSVQIIKYFEELGVDAIVPGEIIDWTVMSYVRDAVQLGKPYAAINLGHYNWEELGMKYAKDWLPELIDPSIPVTYVPTEDMYQFTVK